MGLTGGIVATAGRDVIHIETCVVRPESSNHCILVE